MGGKCKGVWEGCVHGVPFSEEMRVCMDGWLRSETYHWFWVVGILGGGWVGRFGFLNSVSRCKIIGCMVNSTVSDGNLQR